MSEYRHFEKKMVPMNCPSMNLSEVIYDTKVIELFVYNSMTTEAVTGANYSLKTLY